VADSTLTPAAEGPFPMFAQGPVDRPGPARAQKLQQALQAVDEVVFADNVLDEQERMIFTAWLHQFMMRAQQRQQAAQVPQEPSADRYATTDYDMFGGAGGMARPEYQ